MKFKSTLIAAVTVGLLAGSATGIAAQTDEAEASLYFTGTLNFDQAGGPEPSGGHLPGTECPAGGAVQTFADDIVMGAVLESSDPRISGTFDFVQSFSMCEDDGWPQVMVFDTTYRIVNDAGSWTGGGPGFVVFDEDIVGDGPNDALMATLTGEGAYEGHTAILFKQQDSVSGVIIPGEIAPPSDFDGSQVAVEWLIPNEDDEDDEDEELTGIAADLDAAAQVAATIHTGDIIVEAGINDEWETLADLMASEFGPPPEWVEQAKAEMDQLGIAPEEAENYYANVYEDNDEGGGKSYLFATAFHFDGADPAALLELMHPDGESIFNFPDSNPGTKAEELQFGDNLVYRIWNDGVPHYVYFGDDVRVEIFGGGGPEVEPDEATVEAFFTALEISAD